MSKLKTMMLVAASFAGVSLGEGSLEMTDDEVHSILDPRGQAVLAHRIGEKPKFDARKFLDEAKARQDHKRQARAIAKHAGFYVR